MQKLEQRIKELQALIGNPEFNEIIKEKLTDVWRDTQNETDRKWIERQDDYLLRLNASLSREEQEKMFNSHKWRILNDEGDEECIICRTDWDWIHRWPQYCYTKEQQKSLNL